MRKNCFQKYKAILFLLVAAKVATKVHVTLHLVIYT